jgi:hypothetical protein
MRPRTAAIIAGAAITGAVVVGGGIALATGGGDDSEPPISADALDEASAAALDHTGEGRVTDTEVGDEESYYEVEVTRPDGSQVDVQLDRAFNVVGDKADRENEPGERD